MWSILMNISVYAIPYCPTVKRMEFSFTLQVYHNNRQCPHIQPNNANTSMPAASTPFLCHISTILILWWLWHGLLSLSNGTSSSSRVAHNGTVCGSQKGKKNIHHNRYYFLQTIILCRRGWHFDVVLYGKSPSDRGDLRPFLQLSLNEW